METKNETPKLYEKDLFYHYDTEITEDGFAKIGLNSKYKPLIKKPFYFSTDGGDTNLYKKYYASAYRFSEGLACVSDDGETFYFINEKNEIVFSLEKHEQGYIFHEGFCRIKGKDGKYYYRDKQGQVAFNGKKFIEASLFTCGHACVQEDSGLYYFMDRSGGEAFGGQRFTWASRFVDKAARVKDVMGRDAWLKLDGTIRFDQSLNIKSHEEELKENKKIVNEEEELKKSLEVVKKYYNRLRGTEPQEQNKCLNPNREHIPKVYTVKDSLQKYLSTDGGKTNCLGNIVFDWIRDFYEGLAYFSCENGNSGFVTENLELIRYSQDFQWCSDFEDGIAIGYLFTNKRIAVSAINRDGVTITNFSGTGQALEFCVLTGRERIKNHFFRLTRNIV